MNPRKGGTSLEEVVMEEAQDGEEVSPSDESTISILGGQDNMKI